MPESKPKSPTPKKCPPELRERAVRLVREAHQLDRITPVIQDGKPPAREGRVGCVNALLDVDVPEFVTVQRAMRATGRSHRTIYRWKETGAVRWRMFKGRLMVEVNDADEAKIRCSDARLANLRRD